MEMAHGTTTEFTPHIGLCLTDDDTAAADYAIYDAHDDGDPVIHWIHLTLDGLTVAEIDGYDPTGNVAPGDRDELDGADVVVFDDETVRGRVHRTWRLITPAAVAAIEFLCTEEAE